MWAAAIPLLTALAVLVVRLRVAHGRTRAQALRWTIAELGILAGTLPWIWMILTPTTAPGGINLIPLRDLLATISEASTNSAVQVLANLAVFAPLGFLLPLRIPWFANTARTTLTAAALSATLEFAQYALDLGRYTSVDDVLLNAAGATLGTCLARTHLRRRESGRSHTTRILGPLGWA